MKVAVDRFILRNAPEMSVGVSIHGGSSEFVGWRLEVRRYVDEKPFVVIVGTREQAEELATKYRTGVLSALQRPARR